VATHSPARHSMRQPTRCSHAGFLDRSRAKVRSHKWSSLRAWGMQIAKRRGMARARVAVARKLTVILHRMWRDQTEFRFGKEPIATVSRAAA
jgi:hypothetical protein